MKLHNFRKLEIYQRSQTLAVNILLETKGKRPYKVFDQLVGSALSVPSNIAEGSVRGSQKEFIRFLNYSWGSLTELITQLEIILKSQLIDQELGNLLLTESLKIEQMLESFIRVQLNNMNFNSSR
ncbi:MAG: four helix bundle protein [Bacteroidetes bacterium]|nr:four helix bundle protein [Bacteroidota bacterium]